MDEEGTHVLVLFSIFVTVYFLSVLWCVVWFGRKRRVTTRNHHIIAIWMVQAQTHNSTHTSHNSPLTQTFQKTT